MKGTSVTAVLIGKETYNRDWVEYEIKKSWKEGNGIVGIRVHNLEDKDGRTDSRGKNPLSNIYIEEAGRKKVLRRHFQHLPLEAGQRLR